MERFTGLIGIAAVLAVCYLFSNNRKAIKPRVIFWGLGLQAGFAFLVLKTPIEKLFLAASNAIQGMLGYSLEGSKFLFGDKLGAPSDAFGTNFAFARAAASGRRTVWGRS